MSEFNINAPFTRRRALGLGASVAGGILAANAFGGKLAWADTAASSPMQDDVIKQVEAIIQAQGMVSNGVFTIGIDRNDITDVTLRGVPIDPAFELNGSLVFQSANGTSSLVIMNSDMCLKPEELDPFIYELISHNIVFQAEHQHFYDFNPLVWFVHFRAVGDPITIAHSVKAALNKTSTPFPQTLPTNPTTPLPADAIGKILGSSPNISSDGVVTYDVPRKETIRLGGRVINPYLNVQTTVAFQPYGGGSNAAGAPDFGMIASEINTVVGIMQYQGWDIGCLYNQETDEYPQLYFSHQFKTGDAIELAKEIRNGLNHMNVQFM